MHVIKGLPSSVDSENHFQRKSLFLHLTSPWAQMASRKHCARFLKTQPLNRCVHVLQSREGGEWSSAVLKLLKYELCAFSWKKHSVFNADATRRKVIGLTQLNWCDPECPALFYTEPLCGCTLFHFHIIWNGRVRGGGERKAGHIAPGRASRTLQPSSRSAVCSLIHINTPTVLHTPHTHTPFLFHTTGNPQSGDQWSSSVQHDAMLYLSRNEHWSVHQCTREKWRVFEHKKNNHWSFSDCSVVLQWNSYT